MKHLTILVCLVIMSSFISCSQNIDTSQQKVGNIKVVLSSDLSEIIENVNYSFDWSLSAQSTVLSITYTVKENINYHPGVRGFRLLDGNVLMKLGERDIYDPPSDVVKLWNRKEDTKVDENYYRNGYISFTLGSITAKATNLIYLYKD